MKIKWAKGDSGQLSSGHIHSNELILVIRALFNWVSQVIPQLLWFCIATLCDWLKNLAPLPRPIRSKTKTNRDLLASVFPRLARATCICFELWLVHCIVYDCCDWSEYLLWFWYYDTRLKTALKLILVIITNLKPLKFHIFGNGICERWELWNIFKRSIFFWYPLCWFSLEINISNGVTRKTDTIALKCTCF